MYGLDQYFLLEWLSAWLVLNWGAHLALSRQTDEENFSGQDKRQWPRLNEQFIFILNSAFIAWLIQWSWQLLPPIGWSEQKCDTKLILKILIHWSISPNWVNNSAIPDGACDCIDSARDGSGTARPVLLFTEKILHGFQFSKSTSDLSAMQSHFSN